MRAARSRMTVRPCRRAASPRQEPGPCRTRKWSVRAVRPRQEPASCRSSHRWHTHQPLISLVFLPFAIATPAGAVRVLRSRPSILGTRACHCEPGGTATAARIAYSIHPCGLPAEGHRRDSPPPPWGRGAPGSSSVRGPAGWSASSSSTPNGVGYFSLGGGSKRSGRRSGAGTSTGPRDGPKPGTMNSIAGICISAACAWIRTAAC